MQRCPSDFFPDPTHQIETIRRYPGGRVISRSRDVLPDSGSTRAVLAEGYHKRGEFTAAFDLLENVTNDSSVSLRERLSAGLQWVGLARTHRHESTLRAYRTALDLVGRRMITTPIINFQRGILTLEVIKSLPLQAASYAIENGQFESAVEMLEQGRALLWSRMRGYRHPLEELRSHDDKLATEFARLSADMERLALITNIATLLPDPVHGAARSSVQAPFDGLLRRQRTVHEEWEQTVAKIRQMDGFSSFLRARPFHELQVAAMEGPVIFVTVDASRSDAIIIRANHPPTSIPLVNNLPAILSRLYPRLLHVERSARQQWERASKLYDHDQLTTSDHMTLILEALWRNVCQPIAAELELMGVPRKSRVWWCPTGDISPFPLHAAGMYGEDGGQNMFDLYIPSYTPTLSALINARETMNRHSPKLNTSVFAVGQSDTLPQVRDRIENACVRLSSY